MSTSDFPVRILGIDPGSRVIGFATLASRKETPLLPRDFFLLGAGVIKLNADLSLPERLGNLFASVSELIEEFKPTHGAVERSFYGLNASTGIKLGEARGAIMAALTTRAVPVMQIAPAQVKRLIAGSGAAPKEAVALSLKTLLKFDRGKLPYDVTDALAIALASGMMHGVSHGHPSASPSLKSRRPRSTSGRKESVP